jgi:peptidyl-dipeptidase Dcp
VTYPFIAGTNVAHDFVELPSQLYEHWLMVPEVLTAHARHYRTGAPMPAELIGRLRAAEWFNQGFATVEYLASALVDLEMHVLEGTEGFDPQAFQARVLERIGMPHEIVMRHASPHFQHVFSGDGYAAGYYSYMWSEVMDADAFRAFEETGDVFDSGIAARLAEFVYAAGGRQEPDAAYVAFRGKLPGVEALLEGRGLV